MKSFGEFGVELQNGSYWRMPMPKQKATQKEKVNILKMIRAVLADVLLVGLEWNITMPQESITLKKRKDAKYSNREHWKIQRKRQTASWEQKNKIQEHQKNKDRYTEKTLRIEKKTEKQWGKHKERDTKEKK